MRTIKAAFRPVGYTWYRDDTWTDAETGRDRVESIGCAGKGDMTEPHPTHAEYDPTCAPCWLGHSHTRARHAKMLGTKS